MRGYVFLNNNNNNNNKTIAVEQEEEKNIQLQKIRIDFSFRREVFFIVAGALMGAIVLYEIVHVNQASILNE
jgi:hypothetical protein